LAAAITAQKEAREKLDALGNSLAGVREARATAQATVNELTRRLEVDGKQETEYQSEIAALDAAAAKAGEDHAAVEARLQELHASEAALLEKRAHTQTGDVGDKEALRSLREKLDEVRNEERSVQRKTTEVAEGLNQIKVSESELGVRMETLAEKAQTEVEIADLRALAEKFLADQEAAAAAAANAPVSAATGEAIVDESAPADAAAVVVDDVDVTTLSDDALGDLIGAIEEKIGRLGPVNMCAIDELAELEAREEFLKVEQEDIQKAADHLMQMIDRLNGECDRRFEDTFNTVRANFQDMFTYLFGGGQAELVLAAPEAGEDQLDRGIDIIARPPGKSPKSISLLSGGEKALCAVALLFAIFRSKPSPFCILDEVDGPLDESNIDRFMEAVGNFTSETQFIIISHSKRTMSMVDTIYGVTQEQPGVSTRYSLKLTNDYEGKLRGENDAEGEGSPAAEAAAASPA
ncbi:MAG: hypothetical protein J6333_00905, partial [Planctomycetes bacterium]|nr:hypothetical protein [Planctomycetota bacterium]